MKHFFLGCRQITILVCLLFLPFGICFAQIIPPYFDDFEGANAGWTVDSVSGSTWELGTPTTAPTNSTHSGVNAWDVDLNNPYQPYTECYLLSPLFDFSTPAGYFCTISFWLNRETATGDGARLDYSIDSGVTWQVLGVTGGFPSSFNWYNTPLLFSSGLAGWEGNSSGWLYSFYQMNEVNGASKVKFRFAFTSDGINGLTGFSVDDFAINCLPYHDAGVTNIIEPDTTAIAGLGSAVTVYLANFGYDTLFSIPVSYSINGIQAGTTIYNGALPPWPIGSGTIISLGNMIVPSGSYQICVYTSLPGDTTSNNDTICKTLTSTLQPISVSVTDSIGFIDCTDPPVNDLINIFGTGTALSNGDTVNVQVFFGDGTDTTFIAFVNNQTFAGSVYHSYLFNGFYSIQAVAYTNTGIADTVINYNQLIIGDTCGNISGKIYADLNGNCIFDSSDFPLSGIQVRLMQGTNIIKSNFSKSNGDYNFNVPSMTLFDLMIDTSQAGILAYCPPSGKITGITEPSLGNDFGWIAAGGFDLEPSVNSLNTRPNVFSTIFFTLQNHSLLPTTGSFRLLLDTNLLHIISSYPVISQINGDTLIWNSPAIGNYSNGNLLTIRLEVNPDQSLVLGDSVCMTLIGFPVAGDIVPGNNVKNICGTVTNSYDPNNKTVEPAGDFDDPDGLLTYTINFQNTGNASAFNVFLIDTIDSDLDINSLQVIKSSHPVAITMADASVFKFSFNNIFLPDSGSDEPGSHGFISYSIAPKPGLTNGTQISNTAYIYFDFNPAIITNTTNNTVNFPVGINETVSNSSIIVYPNPANEVIHVISRNKGGDLMVYDVYGKLVLSERMNNYHQELQVKNWKAGVYFITLKTKDSTLTQRVVVIR